MTSVEWEVGSELTIDTASERRETDAALAERMVREALAKARWREVDLASRPRGHHVKVKIAQQLRRRTPMRRQWIADRLRIGSPAMSQIYSPVSIVSSDPYCDPGFLEIVSDDFPVFHAETNVNRIHREAMLSLCRR